LAQRLITTVFCDGVVAALVRCSCAEASAVVEAGKKKE
jgi:hypothetical protein